MKQTSKLQQWALSAIVPLLIFGAKTVVAQRDEMAMLRQTQAEHRLRLETLDREMERMRQLLVRLGHPLP